MTNIEGTVARNREGYVRMVARKFSLTREEAEDVVQDAILATIKSVQDDHPYIAAYLGKACIRKAMDRKRNNDRAGARARMAFVTLSGEELERDFAYTDTAFEAVVAGELDVDALTSGLTPEHREAVSTWLAGEDDADAARRAGVPMTTYRGRRFRALVKLRAKVTVEPAREVPEYVPAHRPRTVPKSRTLSKRLRPATKQTCGTS